MELSVYQAASKRTCPLLGEKYNLDANLGSKLDFAHMAMGVASELSELFECLDKNKIDNVNLQEELGDLTWYGANWASLLGVSLDTDDVFNGDDSVYSAPEIDLVIFGGMLSDLGKRFLAYQSDFTQQELKRLGDFEKGKTKVYYSNEEILINYWKAIDNLADQFDLDIKDIMGLNIVKLYKRYPEKFTEDEALNRDLDAERVVLENKNML